MSCWPLCPASTRKLEGQLRELLVTKQRDEYEGNHEAGSAIKICCCRGCRPDEQQPHHPPSKRPRRISGYCPRSQSSSSAATSSQSHAVGRESGVSNLKLLECLTSFLSRQQLKHLVEVVSRARQPDQPQHLSTSFTIEGGPCLSVTRTCLVEHHDEPPLEPHQLTCRLYRWPSLSGHDRLCPLPLCHDQTDDCTEEICANPFHWSRLLDDLDLSAEPYDPARHCIPRPSSPLAVITTANTEEESRHVCGKMSKAPTAKTRTESPPPPYTQMDDYSATVNVPSSTEKSNATSLNLEAEEARKNHSNTGKNRNRSDITLNVTSNLRWPKAEQWAFVKYWERREPLSGVIYVESPSFEANYYLQRQAYPNRSVDNVFRVETLRPTSVEPCMRTRRAIGAGLALSRTEGHVLLHNRSDMDIFFDSTTLTPATYGRRGLTTHKLRPGFAVKIFDFKLAESQRERRTNVDMDSARVTFSKGFGRGPTKSYKNQTAMQCNCWFEIHFRVHRPSEHE